MEESLHFAYHNHPASMSFCLKKQPRSCISYQTINAHNSLRHGSQFWLQLSAARTIISSVTISSRGRTPVSRTIFTLTLTKTIPTYLHVFSRIRHILSTRTIISSITIPSRVRTPISRTILSQTTAKTVLDLIVHFAV